MYVLTDLSLIGRSSLWTIVSSQVRRPSIFVIHISGEDNSCGDVDTSMSRCGQNISNPVPLVDITGHCAKVAGVDFNSDAVSSVFCELLKVVGRDD